MDTIKKTFSKKALMRYARILGRIVKRNEILIKNAVFVILIIGIFGGGAFLLWAASLKTPDINSFDTRLAGISTKIYDRTGNILLYDVNSEVRRTVIPYDQISSNVKNATVAIEDAEFYSHNGIRISSIIRAAFANLFSGGFSQGGSTITQQVIKNSLLTQDKTISRKIKEWILALKLERVATKDEILNLYLNTNPYGGNIYGIEEASEVFFGKHASDLDVAESAYIAALPQAPSYYSPFGSHKKELDTRKDLVLKRMLDNNFITKDQYEKSQVEVVAFKDAPLNTLKAPHFVMFVKQYLEEKYGAEAVAEGGLKVITSLDYDMEQKAETILKNYVTTNETKFKAENGSIVAIDPRNGQILTMAGSRDYFDKEIDGNYNIATALRQPGSSFKPFVYATLFDKGYTPNTILFDTQTEFSTNCTPNSVPLFPDATCYAPRNYEGRFEGPLTIRKALAESRNIPAIKALYLAGINDTLKTAKDLGIQQLKSANDYGLPLAIGAAEVSLLDMTSAYGVFADNGIRNPYTSVLKVEDKNGNTLEEFATSSQQVFNEQPILELNDVLSDNSARAPIFGSNYIPGHAMAIKTGTTNDSRDAWIMGYTPSLSIGAWMGNNDNSPMAQIASALIVAPMWKQFTLAVLKDKPNEEFKKPEPMDDSALKPVFKGVWQNGTGNVDANGVPQYDVHSILYYVNKDDPLGPAPTNPSSDPEFNLWEYGVQNWAISQGYLPSNSIQISTSTASAQPSGDVRQYAPKPVFTSPQTNDTYAKNERVDVNILNEGSLPLAQVQFYVGNTPIGTALTPPFSTTFVPNELTSEVKDTTSKLTIRAVAKDTSGNTGEETTTIRIK